MAEIGENLERFLKYVENERDNISDRIREFQLAHRDNFKNMDSSCEYRHEHADIYNKYISLLESFSEHFKEEQGLTDDDLLDMVRNLKESSPEMWSPFQALIDKTDYTVFAKCLVDGTCLCCGASYICDGKDEDEDEDEEEEGRG